MGLFLPFRAPDADHVLHKFGLLLAPYPSEGDLARVNPYFDLGGAGEVFSYKLYGGSKVPGVHHLDSERAVLTTRERHYRVYNATQAKFDDNHHLVGHSISPGIKDSAMKLYPVAESYIVTEPIGGHFYYHPNFDAMANPWGETFDQNIYTDPFRIHVLTEHAQGTWVVVFLVLPYAACNHQGRMSLW